MVTNGVIADYALVAEATSFKIAWVEAGKAHYKITVWGQVPTVYSPHLKRPYTAENNPNAIIRASKLIDKLEDWAFEYEKKHIYESPGGTVTPKVCIGAVRGGAPYFTGGTPELCSVYLDVRTAPGQDVVAIKGEIKDIIRSLGLEAEVEMYRSLPGYEAKNIDRLAQAIERSHQRLFNEDLQKVVGPEASMWRDINVFNEVGIPAATYGPAAGAGEGIYHVKLDDMYKAAQAYAATALDLCNQEKTP